MARIAVVQKERCKPHECGNLCMKVCPVNKTGGECIWLGEDTKAKIDEMLCIGCGICPKKCPYDAISIINLPEELDRPPIHRYGRNGFHLYHLPTPIFGKVVGIIGKNGIGKSTALNILSGTLKPNLGRDTAEQAYEADADALIEYFKGTEAQGYFEKMRDGKLTVAVKPQMVDAIPKQFSGSVRNLFEQISQDTAKIAEISAKLALSPVLDRDIGNVSGGELQRIAIAATVLKEANVYFFDEPTSYLDIKQRLIVSNFIRELADQNTAVLVIEHDLIILDYMTDLIHLMYGKENAYGVCSLPKSTKNGINLYLSGFLRDENIRFRNYAIDFTTSADLKVSGGSDLVSWTEIKKTLGSFELTAKEGVIRKHEVVGVLGENGIGKTSFVKILAGAIESDSGSVDGDIKVSYKPQYVKTDSGAYVMEVLQESFEKYKMQIIKPLEIDTYADKKVSELSGGQLQRVTIAAALQRDADLYLLDEPSAYLDVEQRLAVSKVIKDFMLEKGKAALVVDHDLLFIDYLSSSLVVYDGEPAIKGISHGPFGMQEGMNMFLQDIGLTFRRDEESGRPRANKPGSQMDQKQKSENMLYYI
ncbi:MAG: ribosome biogenesis/translation initiation ATPase RLI [Nanoarchaeota archaeon]